MENLFDLSSELCVRLKVKNKARLAVVELYEGIASAINWSERPNKPCSSFSVSISCSEGKADSFWKRIHRQSSPYEKMSILTAWGRVKARRCHSGAYQGMVRGRYTES